MALFGFVFVPVISLQLSASSYKERGYGDLACFEIGFACHKKGMLKMLTSL